MLTNFHKALLNGAASALSAYCNIVQSVQIGLDLEDPKNLELFKAVSNAITNAKSDWERINKAGLAIEKKD